MDDQNRAKLKPIIQLLEGILPEIDDVLQYMEKNGGWLPLTDEFIQSLHNLKITNWAEYYLDSKKLKALTNLCFYDEEELKRASEAPEAAARDNVLAMLTEELNEALSSEPPTKEEIHEFSRAYSAAPESGQIEISKTFTIIILSFLANLFNYLSLMVYGKTICQLVTSAENGDDDSLCQAIRIDRTILFLPFVQERLSKAQLSNDEEFLRNLGSHLKRPILKGKIRYRKLYLLFAVLEDEGLLNLSHGDLLNICERLGVYGDEFGNADVNHLGKRLREYKKKNMPSKDF